MQLFMQVFMDSANGITYCLYWIHAHPTFAAILHSHAGARCHLEFKLAVWTMVNRINMLHFVLSRLIGFVDQINMMFKFKLSVIDIGFAAYKCMLMSLHMLLCL